MAEKVEYQLLASPSARLNHVMRIFTRVLGEKSGVDVQAGGEASLLRLAIRPGSPENGYCIATEGDGIGISASDELGLLYGLGKFLHTSTYGPAGFSPSSWRGASAPDGHTRGIYFANNFGNWNYTCTVEAFTGYLEELVLWGLNTVAFNFVLYDNLPEPERGEYLRRNRQIIEHANGLGLKVVLLYAPNFGFGPIPPEIQASPFPDTNPARRGAGDNPVSFVCPSKPEGHAFIMSRLRDDFSYYSGLTIDSIATFPYDAGGCGCADCWPWGAKGFPLLSRDVIALAREQFPACKLILCTWCYDVREESDGEYEGLARLLASDGDWCDMIMADAHGNFPTYPLEHGVPGGLPMINFAEISMWGRFPWGGSGANPFPRRIADLWGQAKHLLDGGLPYSEGRFEDINKVICISLFWNREAEAVEIIRDYANFEFGTATIQSVSEAIDILETIYPESTLTLEGAERALTLLRSAESVMTSGARSGWRWRILLLRAIIDVERMRSPDCVTEARNAAYEELTRIYLAGKAGGPVAPRARSFFERPDIHLKGPRFASHIGEHASDPSQIT